MKKWGFRLVTWFNGLLRFSIRIHTGAIDNSHSLQFTIHSLILSVCCPFTSPLAKASNGWRSSSWVPELSLCHSHSNSWLSVYSLTPFILASMLTSKSSGAVQLPTSNLVDNSRTLISRVEVEFNLRPTVSLSWCQAPIWNPRPIFLSPWDFLLDSCWFVIL
jgi:hypothetical protein